MGESRSVSEVHKPNLGARFSKNHQITDKLHTMIAGNKIILDCLTMKLLLTGSVAVATFPKFMKILDPPC